MTTEQEFEQPFPHSNINLNTLFEYIHGGEIDTETDDLEQVRETIDYLHELITYRDIINWPTSYSNIDDWWSQVEPQLAYIHSHL